MQYEEWDVNLSGLASGLTEKAQQYYKMYEARFGKGKNSTKFIRIWCSNYFPGFEKVTVGVWEWKRKVSPTEYYTDNFSPDKGSDLHCLIHVVDADTNELLFKNF